MKTPSATRILFAASALGLALCAPAAAQQTVKIGSVLSVTGPASFLGEPEEKTIKMYVDKINAAGGVAGKKIDLVIYDDGGDASKARTFATRLIEDDKVVAEHDTAFGLFFDSAQKREKEGVIQNQNV